MTITHPHERARLEALLRELRPIEARCLPMSDNMLRCIQVSQALQEGKEERND
jgi:hypothetical protein